MKQFAKSQKQGVPPQGDWDALAGVYQAIERIIFGDQLQAARRRLVDWAPQEGKVVIVGEGDGRLLVELLQARPNLAIRVLEPSRGMREEITSRVAGECGEPMGNRVTLVPEPWQSTAGAFRDVDAVILPFLLDLHSHDEIRILARELRDAQVTQVFIAEFTVPAGNAWQNLRARLILRGLYFAARRFTGLKVKSLPDYPEIFREAGFSLRDHETFSQAAVIAEMWAAEPPVTGD